MRIFVSYRRTDTRHAAGRIGSELRRLVGGPEVFVDVTSLRAGGGFAEAIASAVRAADVVLVLIGERWLDVPSGGRPRLFDPEDFVRREVALALAHAGRVIPLLVDDAVMPERDALPEDLRPLCDRHAQRIRYDAFERDFQHLVATLVPSARVRPFLPSPLAHAGAGLAVSVALVLLVGVVHWSATGRALDQSVGELGTTLFLLVVPLVGTIAPAALRSRSAG